MYAPEGGDNQRNGSTELTGPGRLGWSWEGWPSQTFISNHHRGAALRRPELDEERIEILSAFAPRRNLYDPPLPFYQSDLFGSGPAFDLRFAFCSSTSCEKLFKINDILAWVITCVVSTFTCLMLS